MFRWSQKPRDPTATVIADGLALMTPATPIAVLVRNGSNAHGFDPTHIAQRHTVNPAR